MFREGNTLLKINSYSWLVWWSWGNWDEGGIDTTARESITELRYTSESCVSVPVTKWPNLKINNLYFKPVLKTRFESDSAGITTLTEVIQSSTIFPSPERGLRVSTASQGMRNLCHIWVTFIRIWQCYIVSFTRHASHAELRGWLMGLGAQLS